MGIRETLNRNPAITTGATIAIIVIALIVIVMQAHTSRPKVYAGNQYFFTDDDGATWFPADYTNIPPFTDKNGLTAFRCYVYKCGKNKFVGYLEKYSDDARKRMSESGNKPAMPGMPDPDMMHGGRLLKKKGGNDWVPLNPSNPTEAAKIEDIVHVTCPDGSSDVTQINPGD